MEEHQAEEGELSLRFPLFVVATEQDEGHDGLIIVEVNGQECCPRFLSQEVAELYAEQSRDAGGEERIVVRKLAGADGLKYVLGQLPASVGHVVWDAIHQPQAVRLTSMGDVKAALGMV